MSDVPSLRVVNLSGDNARSADSIVFDNDFGTVSGCSASPRWLVKANEETNGSLWFVKLYRCKAPEIPKISKFSSCSKTGESAASIELWVIEGLINPGESEVSWVWGNWMVIDRKFGK